MEFEEYFAEKESNKINNFIVYPFVFMILSSIIHHRCNAVKTPFSIKISNPTRFAFATFATPSFAMGAVTLGHTLQELHGSDYDRICLVSKDMSNEWVSILEQYWRVIKVNDFSPSITLRRSWTKLRCWSLVDYEKIVYIDCDIIVLKRLDKLFSMPELSCVPDSSTPQLCNTGLLVIKPRLWALESFEKAYDNLISYQFDGDQPFINYYFREFTPIPSQYNAPRVSDTSLGDFMNENKVFCLHFVCKKPWRCQRNESKNCGCGFPEYGELWWNTWDKACTDKKCKIGWKERSLLA